MRNRGPEGRGEAVVALGRDYADGSLIDAHRHARAQLLYGMTGVALVQTPEGAWMMPPDCALWIPPGRLHEVRMIGAVRMRNIYLRPNAAPAMPAECTVLAMSDLMRSLVAEVARPRQDENKRDEGERDEGERGEDDSGRTAALTALLLNELPRLPAIALSAPLPAAPRLRALCRGFLLEPSVHTSIEEWSARLHMSRRSFTRQFRAQTGMSFGDWKKRACVLAAIPRLMTGTPVTEVAMALGYDNPASFSAMFRQTTGTRPSRYAETRLRDSAPTGETREA
jgi:AraC-like DNA-binding protein